jgi:hypothetical protein
VIISHRFKFIFIKTKKTAGTSIERYLSPLCAADDILTPLVPPEPGHTPRNFRRLFNPIPEVVARRGRLIHRTVRDLLGRRCFYNHTPAYLVRARAGRRIWNRYLKFTVVRNPWDRTLSDYWWKRHVRGNQFTLDEYFRRGRFCRNLRLYTAPDDSRHVLVDRLVRYEHLNEDLGAIFRVLGVPFSGALDIRAKAGFRPASGGAEEVLSASQRQVIAEVFADEIALHGFTDPAA